MRWHLVWDQRIGKDWSFKDWAKSNVKGWGPWVSTNTHQHLLSRQQTRSRDTTAPSGTQAARSVQSLQSCLTLCTGVDYIPHQATLSMGFSNQDCWSGLPCPPPRNLPHPGIEPAPVRTPALAGEFFTTSATWEAPGIHTLHFIAPQKRGGSSHQENKSGCVHACVCLQLSTLRYLLRVWPFDIYDSLPGMTTWPQEIAQPLLSTKNLRPRMIVWPKPPTCLEHSPWSQSAERIFNVLV